MSFPGMLGELWGTFQCVGDSMCQQDLELCISTLEFDNMLKGVNLALEWQAEVLHLRTNFFFVYQWICKILRLKTKVTSEMLNITSVQHSYYEYDLFVDITLVRVEGNIANEQARVSQR